MTDIDLEVEFLKNQTTLMIIPSEIYNDVILKKYIADSVFLHKSCYLYSHRRKNKTVVPI